MTHLKLGTKFIALVIGILILTLGTNTYFSLQQQKKQLQTELIEESKTIASLFSKVSIEALLAHDYMTLNSFAEKILENKNIEYCIFMDPDNNPLTSSVTNNALVVAMPNQEIMELVSLDPDSSAKNSRITLELIKFPIINQHQILGSITIGVNLQQIDQLFQGILIRQIVIYGIILVVLGSAIYFVFSLNVIQPIGELISAARRMAIGNFNQNVDIHANDEIGALSTAFNLMMRDLKKDREKLSHQANYDLLTGLPNRTSATDYIKVAINEYQNEANSFALLFVDINDFKLINDTMGHLMGDQLLITIAKRLQKDIRHPDFVARLGGDVFLLIIRNYNEVFEIEQLSQRLLDTIAAKIHLQQREMHLKASIGIATYPNDGKTSEALMSNADNAMYQAKFNQFGGFCFFSQKMHDQINDRMLLENDLHKAIENQELHLNFQPLIDFETKQCVAVEVLLRWNHPIKGNITPDIFIPIAESTGLIISIGEWVLEQACRAYLQWQAMGLSLDFIAINVSRVQFQSNFVKTMKNVLHKHNIPAHCIELEMTESVLMDEGSQIAQSLHELSNMGFKLSLDDFGTGYSSLSYLRRFPFNTLKIDKSFITEIPHNNNDSVLVKAIMAMAHSLNLKVVGEGVEEQEQSEFLSQLGCNLLQGFLYAKPLSYENFLKFLAKQ